MVLSITSSSLTARMLKSTKKSTRRYSQGTYKMEYMEHGIKRDRIKQDANGIEVKGKNGLPVILPELEVSLDKLVDEDWDFSSSEMSPEEAFF
jgi:hypothetical protein